jgi:hypothetical protein
LAAIPLIVLGLLLALSPALAQGPPPEDRDGAAAGEVDPAASAWDREIGVEYIANYPGTSSDLPCAYNNASGFYNYLRNHSNACDVGNCFFYGNSNAWEQDFKRHDLGGTNNYYVDDVDIVFYEGHGWPGGFTFKTPWGHGTHDDSYLTYSDAYRAWGDRDLEWLALLSCSVLADSHQNDWAWTFNDLHLLLGFETTAYDVCGFGQEFAKRIIQGYSIKYSWFKACDTHQPPGVSAKVMAEEYNHLYDTWYYQYPDDWDYYYYVRTHSCGSQSPWAASVLAGVATQQEDPTSLPAFITPRLTADQANAEWGNLTGAFDLPEGDVSAMQGEDYFVTESGGRALEMDTANGLYYYVDTNQLFTSTAGSEVQILSAQDAISIANEFLANNGLMPGDAQFNTVVEEVVETVEMPGLAMGVPLEAGGVVEQTVTDYQVSYNRVLTYVTTVQQGDTTVQQVNEIPVSGPGSKLKVYVDAAGGQASAAANGLGAVAGAQGGWRGIDTSQLAVQNTVDLLPFDPQIQHLFMELAPQVALEQVPFDSPTSVEILGHQVVEWEEPTGTGQDQLYPAYEILAEFTNDNTTVQDSTWVPANPTYMRPLALIDSHTDTTGNFMVGDVFTATAMDASQQLADLGFHESLTFTLGSGGPYLYDWYAGSVDEAHKIGSGRDLVYTVTVPFDAHTTLAPQAIILQVTDAGTTHSGQDTSIASTEIDVVAPVFLPVVLKH